MEEGEEERCLGQRFASRGGLEGAQGEERIYCGLVDVSVCMMELVKIQNRVGVFGCVLLERSGKENVLGGGPDGAAYSACEGGGPGGGAFSSGILIELVRCPVAFRSIGLELGSLLPFKREDGSSPFSLLPKHILTVIKVERAEMKRKILSRLMPLGLCKQCLWIFGILPSEAQ